MNSTSKSSTNYLDLANAIRALSMDAVEKANSGHPGMPMGMADVATVLFKEFINFNSAEPEWPNRDRFILSAGHGSMLLYAILYLTGYKNITIEDIKNFRQLHSITAGHPEFEVLPGVETTTGPLGQGLANAVGMALAEKVLNSKFGNKVVDHYTYVIAGDGCLMEGISQEAISFAGHLQLNKLIVLFDDNQISIDGPTSLTTSENHLLRFEAANWYVQAIDGHDPEQIRTALINAKNSSRPSMIACRTIIGKGAPTKSGSCTAHGSPLGQAEINATRQNINWPHEPFLIPEDILNEWRVTSQRSNDIFNEWLNNFESLTPDLKSEFERLQRKELPNGWKDSLEELKKDLTSLNSNEATRKSSGNVLKLLTKLIPELIGGSADLTTSNDTKTDNLIPITKENFNGRYIYYGIREHAMAAIMNGMALHKGVIPYGGTFLVFTDYCRPAIRLSALMRQRVIYIMTHDSIGLGEDGPTHQPIEHLASLRAIPNLNVFRPADSIETLECWELALENTETPSILALSRQNLPQVRKEYFEENLSKKGAYILAEHTQVELKVTIFATGSEVSIATEAKEQLEAEGIGTRVVSMPCTSLFDQQEKAYQDNILNNDSIKVAIEAASPFGWERYIGRDGIFIGMRSFGASAPYKDLYKHFGITAENIVKEVKGRL